MGSVTVTYWHKSSFSSSEGNCVEVANWRKSSRSEQSCVEVGAAGVVAIRDTKLAEQSPVLEVSPSAWMAFISSIR